MTRDVYRIGIIGYGTVGKGIVNVLQEQKERIATLLSREVEVEYVLVKDRLKEREGDVSFVYEWDAFKRSTYDVVFECIVGVEPAASYAAYFLKQGIPVITANKEMFAKKGKELREVAKEHGASIRYEATTGGAIPIIRSINELLHVQTFTRIDGIVNGTTNYLVTTLRKEGGDFFEHVKKAQEKGYAEADPSFDIDGWDALFKLRILCESVFGKSPDKETRIPLGPFVQQVKPKEGERVRYIASAYFEGDILHAVISPKIILPEHPLYGVDGVTNAIALTTTYSDVLTFTGPGAGSYPTASAMVDDWISYLKLVKPVVPASVGR